MELIENILMFVGGLGMFLYGMNVMGAGLEKAAGNKMKRLLGLLTNNRFLAVGVGALVTAIIQSSSATTVMVVGFVNAGILNLSQSIGVIMGANIGTTITAWIVSMGDWAQFLKPEFLAPVVIIFGAFTLLVAKDKKKRDIAEIAIGFGVLFIGLSNMSSGIKPYRDSEVFVTAFQTLGQNPILAILAGAVVTAVIQSSSASVGILQTLAGNGMVGWNSAVFITLGQNIGTCVTALISSLGANKTAKRAAMMHLMFNVAGAIIFGVIMFVTFGIFQDWGNSMISKTQISIFHTIFNVSNTIILFPFANLIVKLSGKLVKDVEVEELREEDQVTLRHLDSRILETPSFAVENVILEIVHMGEIAKKTLSNAFEAILYNDKAKCDEVVKSEDTLDKMAAIITEYLVKVNNLNLSEQQHRVLNNLFYTVSDLERIGDHAENLAELGKFKIENDMQFSETALQELKDFVVPVISGVELSVNARRDGDLSAAKEAQVFEEEVDALEEKLRAQHLDRLSSNLCVPTAGVVFLDILSNLERISDHAENIAEYVLAEAE